jgi:hypothetical protein
MAAASVDTPVSKLLASINKSRREAVATAGISALAGSIYVKDGKISGGKPSNKSRTLKMVDEVGLFPTNFVKHTIYGVFKDVFTFLLPETDKHIKATKNVFADLHLSGVSLRDLLGLHPGKYISIKHPRKEDRIYFYRSMTDSGRIYFYSGIGKSGRDAKMGPRAVRDAIGRITNRMGKTRISPDERTLRSIESGLIQVHTNHNDIPAGRYTRRNKRRNGFTHNKTQARRHRKRRRQGHRTTLRRTTQ